MDVTGMNYGDTKPISIFGGAYELKNPDVTPAYSITLTGNNWPKNGSWTWWYITVPAYQDGYLTFQSTPSSFDEFDARTFWPSRVSYEELQSGELNLENREFRRDSWCYGVHGIARALWLAGSAANNKEWSELALSAFLGIENRFSTLGGLTSAPVCHGVAGLIQSVQRMYSETGDKRLESMRDRLIVSILDMYEPGFLNGNAGIALVLGGCICLEHGSVKWNEYGKVNQC